MSPPNGNPDDTNPDTGVDQGGEQGPEERPLFKNIRMPSSLTYKNMQGEKKTVNSRPPNLVAVTTPLAPDAPKEPGKIYTNTTPILEASKAARTTFTQTLTTIPPGAPSVPARTPLFDRGQMGMIEQAVYKNSPTLISPSQRDPNGVPHQIEFSRQLESAQNALVSLAGNTRLSSFEAHERAIKIKDNLLRQVSQVHQRQQTDLTTLLSQTPPGGVAYSDAQKQAATAALSKAQADEKASVEKYANDAVLAFHKRLSEEQFRANILRLGELDPNFAKHIEEKVHTTASIIGMSTTGEPLSTDLSAKLGSPEQFPAYKHKDYKDVTVARLGGNRLNIQMPPYPKDEKKLRAAAELAVRAAINEGFPGIKVSGNTELAKYIWLYSQEIGYRCNLEGGVTPELMKMQTAAQSRQGITARGAASAAMQETPELADDIQSGKVTIPLHIADQNLRAITTASLISQRAQEELNLHIASPFHTVTPITIHPPISTHPDQLRAKVVEIAANHNADGQAIEQLAGITQQMETLSQAIQTKLETKESWLPPDEKLPVFRAPGKASYKIGKDQADYVARVEENAAKVSGSKKEEVHLDTLTDEQKRFAQNAYRDKQLPMIQEELDTLKRLQDRLQPSGDGARMLANLKANNETRKAALIATAGAGTAGAPPSGNNPFHATEDDLKACLVLKDHPTLLATLIDDHRQLAELQVGPNPTLPARITLDRLIELNHRMTVNDDPLTQYADQYREITVVRAQQIKTLELRIAQTNDALPILTNAAKAIAKTIPSPATATPTPGRTGP